VLTRKQIRLMGGQSPIEAQPRRLKERRDLLREKIAASANIVLEIVHLGSKTYISS
jgi:hypothetical protein